MMYNKIKEIIEKAERACDLRTHDLNGKEIDELVLLEATLPYDIISIKTELLTMFEEETK